MAALLAIAAGCHKVLGLDDYGVAPAGGDKCGTAPQTSEQLLNACASGTCLPFDDDARITAFDGSVRPPEPIDAGSDLGSDLGVDSGAPPDADASVEVDSAPSGLPRCADLKPRPVFMHGSSAMALAFRQFAQGISSVATLVYRRDASCNGLDAILTGDTRSTGTAQYWRVDSANTFECELDPGGQGVDIGLCDAFPETCLPGLAGLPPEVGDFTGPVQTFMFTVPKTSTQRSISAIGAYDVYGSGSASGVAPWTDESFIFKRFEKSGTQLVLGASLGLPAEQWHGQRVTSSSDMKPRLLASPSPEQTIGITSADVADDVDARSSLRTLAYRHFGQSCGYTPDSDLGSYDKRNVRDGHYFLWAPFHLYARVSGGAIADPIVRDVVNYLSGVKPLPDKNADVVATLKAGGLIPRCAMRVTRAKEGGALMPFAPHPSCACYFEAAAPSSAIDPGCKVCATDRDCPSARPSCSFGYCEPG